MNKVQRDMNLRLVEACMKAAGFRWVPAHMKTVESATAVAAPSTPAPSAPPPVPRTVTTEKTITNTTTQIIELKPNN
nr:hypothetical protein LVJ77_05670 [Conchiformibius kuhniae]